MILTIGGIKGGTGKSTIAINLACYLSFAEKNKVLLVDADAQGTATDFCNERSDTKENTGFTAIQLHNKAVRTEVQKLSNVYTHIVIDTGGRDTTSQRAALSISNILILPFAPRTPDIWTLDKVSDIIDESKAINEKMAVYAFLNRADPSSRGADNKAAKEIISENKEISFLDVSIGNRKVFADSMANGLSVFEHKPKNQKAIEEIKNLFNTILESK